MKKITWLIITVAAIILGWQVAKQVNRAQPAPGGLVATATAAEVEVTAKYLSQNKFEVAFNTHSGDLSTYDFNQISLSAGLTPTLVDYLSRTTHHPAARLTYSKVITPVILLIPNLAGVPLTRLEFKSEGGEK